MFVHAYQSAIFNRTIDMRINSGKSIHIPLLGDNVIPADSYGGPDQRRIIEVNEYNQNKQNSGNLIKNPKKFRGFRI